MAQSHVSPDLMEEDRDYATESAVPVEGTGEKKSLFGKVKDKARSKTGALRSKLKKKKDPTSVGVADAGNGSSSSSSSSEDENEEPKFQQKGFESGFGGTGNDVASDQPSSFEGTGENDATRLSRDFEGLSTKSKDDDTSIAGGIPYGVSAPAESIDDEYSATEGGESKPYTTRAAEGLLGTTGAAAGVIGAKLGYDKYESEQAPYRAKDAIVGKTEETQDSLADSVTPNDQKSYTQKATDALFGVKDGVVGTAQGAKDSTVDSAYSTKDTLAEKTTPEDQKSYTQKATEAFYGVKDAVLGKAQQYGNTGTGKVGTEDSAVDAAYSTKDSLAQTITPENQKAYPEKASDALYGAKDVVVGKAQEYGAVASEKTTPADGKTYTQKMSEALTGAKDSLFSSTQGARSTIAERTHPGEEDKALSQKVTETLSNLPTSLKTTVMGSGQKSYDVTSENAGTPQSPSIVTRLTDTVSSMFGGKKPEEHVTPAEVTTTFPEEGREAASS